jgi:parvulin-like peptidyl-prolyl isomerase
MADAPFVGAIMRFLCLAVFGLSFGCTQSESEPSEKVDPTDPSRILRAADDDPVAAKVDGTVILRSSLEERVQAQVEQFRLAGRSITPAFEQSTRVALLNHMIDRSLLTAEGKRLGIEVTDAALSHHEALFRERLGNEKAFQGYLARIGRQLEGWRSDQRQHLIQKMVFDQVLKPAPVGEAELLKQYEAQKQRYAQRRRLRLGEILKSVPTTEAMPDKGKRDRARAAAEKSIKKLIRRAQSPGQRFAALAAEQSDSVSKKRGGDLGWRIEESLSPDWLLLLKGAKKGAVVGPIESADGLRLLKVVDVEEARQLSFEDVKGELRRTALSRSRSKAERALVISLRDQANISILDRRLKSSLSEAMGQVKKTP